MPLTARQARFVAAYLKLRDGKAAAIEAGYAPNGAAVQSWRNLRIPEVREALRRADASIVQKVNNVNYVQENANRKLIGNAEVSVGRVLKEASRVAYFDPKDCYGADGQMLSINEMSEDARRAIQGVKLTEFGPEYKVAPKLPALDLLARHLGMVNPPAVPGGPIFAINIHTAPDVTVNVSDVKPVHVLTNGKVHD